MKNKTLSGSLDMIMNLSPEEINKRWEEIKANQKKPALEVKSTIGEDRGRGYRVIKQADKTK